MTQQAVESMVDKCVSTDQHLVDLILDRPCARVQTVNLHHLALAKNLPNFARIVRTANYVTADGWPVVLALKGLGVRAERVTGSEFTRRLLADPRFRGFRVGLLGATSTVGDSFESNLHAAGAKLVYREHGNHTSWSPNRIAGEVSSAAVDLLLVAVTPPRGDELAAAVHEAGFQGTVIAVGGAIDMIVGARKPAPPIVRRLNVEWIYRLLQEPRRLFARYFVLCLPVFISDVLPLALRRFLTK